MKISIIIPVYNTEKYLKECIESCLNQTHDDIEVIAVDDGSTDNSVNILNDYAQKIKIIRKKNGGTASALNVGIKVMNGEWFKWLSSDDVLYNNAVEILVRQAELMGELGMSTIFYSNYDIIDKNGSIVREFIEPDYNNLNNLQRNVILLDHYFGNGTTSLIHKSLFDRFGVFDESIGYKEDYEFWLRCCLIYGCRLFLIPDKLAKYRIHPTQLTRKKVQDNLERVEIIKNMVLAKLSEDERKQYLDELRKYQKNKPLNVQIRRKMRNIMLKILPKNASSKIIETYMHHKNS